MKKYWVVRSGEVGTVHLSRDGREVDFRPGRAVIRVARPCDLGDESDEEVVKAILESVILVLVPAKGVGCESLAISPTGLRHTVETMWGWVQVKLHSVTAVYEGLTLTAVEQESRWDRRPCVVAAFESFVERRTAREFAAEQLRQVQAAAGAARTLTVRKAIKYGMPVYTHLRKEEMWRWAAGRTQARILAHFGVRDVRLLVDWAQDLASLREQILAAYPGRNKR